MEEILLNIFGLVGVGSSIMVIRARKGVHSVLYLVFVFLNMGGVLILYEVEFIGLILIMVYVGAVAILFLFIVMMVGGDEERVVSNRWVSVFSLGVVGGLICYRILKVLSEGRVDIYREDYSIDNVENIKSIGEVLFTENMYGVLVGGFVLLVAMIGGVVLGLKKS